MIRYCTALVLLLCGPALGATALQGLNEPSQVALTTNALELTFNRSADYLVIGTTADSAVYLEVDCTDGGSVGTHFFTIPASTIFTIAVDRMKGKEICLAAVTGSPTVSVMAKSAGR